MPALKIAHNVHAEAGKAAYRVDLPKSYRTMEAKFERYNQAQERTSDKIKMPHVFLAKELIRLYARKFSVWQITGDRILNKAQDMPLLSINNKFLGEITGRTDRSIRNYRKVLQRAGFFLPVSYDEHDMPVYEVHHGRQADFEVAINPDFLWMEVSKTKEKFRIPTSPLKALTRKNFPPTSTSTVQEQQEQQELVGGKSCAFAEKSAQEQPEQQEPSSGEPNGSSTGRQEPGYKNEPRRLGPHDKKTGTEVPAGGDDFDPDRAQKVRNQSKILLNGARTYLYPGEVWSKEYRIKVLQELDRLFGYAPAEKFAKITGNYWERMKLCQLYWHKQFGELPEPHIFFNPDNPDGFRAARGWVDQPEKYPPPARQTYRKPGERRANGRRGQGIVTLGDLI